MKITFGIFGVLVVAAIGAILLAGCRTSSPAEIEGTKYMVGDLKLVAKYKPLHLYIYANTTTATNKLFSYAILQGNEPIVLAVNESNSVTVILCEKSFRGQLATTYDYAGKMLKRSFSVYKSNLLGTNYLYFDTNADGLWDRFVIDGGGTNENISGYSRSNLCWVPIRQN